MNGSVSPRSAIKGNNESASSSSGAKYVGKGSRDISGFLKTESFMNTKFPTAPGTWWIMEDEYYFETINMFINWTSNSYQESLRVSLAKHYLKEKDLTKTVGYMHTPWITITNNQDMVGREVGPLDLGTTIE